MYVCLCVYIYIYIYIYIYKTSKYIKTFLNSDKILSENF